MRPIVVIPAYQPGPELITLVKQICAADLNVVVVNDGSNTRCDHIFATLREHHIHVLQHATNLGKGQALKTAFNHVLTQHPDAPGVITADADGQHAVNDIIKVSEAFTQNPASLWLGVRVFDGKVPFRSRFGNEMTRWVCRLFINQPLKDTQTGLRGVPRSFMQHLLSVQSSGYEFELDMLILASKNHLAIKEYPIKTIYNNNNESSHFNPIIDSLKIYFVFFRYLFGSIVCGALDYLFFSITFFISGHIFISESLARGLSGSINFVLNKHVVFRSDHDTLPQIQRYILLCAVNLGISWAIIKSLTFIGVSEYVGKLIALGILFIANFAIQRLMIFTREPGFDTPSKASS